MVLVLFPAVPLGTELGAERTKPGCPWMEAGQGLRRFPVAAPGAEPRRGRRCPAWRQRCEGRLCPQLSFWRLCFCAPAGVGTDRRTLCWPCELGNTSTVIGLRSVWARVWQEFSRNLRYGSCLTEFIRSQ